MTTELDIVDTIVKIGLGAIISGISTYMVSKKSHSHEMEIDFTRYKRNTLIEISNLIDEASNLRNDAVHLRNEAVDFDGEKLEESAIKISGLYLSASNLAKTASTKCHLIGDIALAELTKEYFEILADLYIMFQERSLGDESAYSALYASYDNAKKKILAKYGNSLEKIYKK